MQIENKIITDSANSVNNEQKVKELELSMTAKLPNELVDLLVKNEKIAFERKKFVRIIDDNFKQEMMLESIFSIDEIIQGMNFLRDEEDVIKNKLLIFGETLGSPVICIGLRENNYGFVYVLDWDFGLTKVSDSFVEFVNSLK